MIKVFGREVASKKKRDEMQKSQDWIAWILVIFSAVALVASLALSYEYVHVLKNPEAQLACSINSVLNCAPSLHSALSSTFFNIPNSFFGMIGFTAALALAVVMTTRTKLPRWMYVCMQIGVTVGLAFGLWLFFSSLYVIGALCPWCLSVTFSTIMLFAAMMRFNLRARTLELRDATDKMLQKWLDNDIDKLFWALVIVVLIALAIVRFGSAIFG